MIQICQKLFLKIMIKTKLLKLIIIFANNQKMHEITNVSNKKVCKNSYFIFITNLIINI